MILIEQSSLVIKEPFLSNITVGDGEVGVRVDHMTDLVRIDT
jgi:hypothetical protein